MKKIITLLLAWVLSLCAPVCALAENPAMAPESSALAFNFSSVDRAA